MGSKFFNWNFIKMLTLLITQCETVDDLITVSSNVVFFVFPSSFKSIFFLYDGIEKALQPAFGLIKSETTSLEDYEKNIHLINHKQIASQFNMTVLRYHSIEQTSILFDTIIAKGAYHCDNKKRYDDFCCYFDFDNFVSIPIKNKQKIYGVVILNGLRRDRNVMNKIDFLSSIFFVYMDNLAKAENVDNTIDKQKNGGEDFYFRKHDNIYNIGKATAVVAHEIKNSLVGVIGLFNKLKNYVEKNEKTTNYINIIDKELSRIHSLTFDINQYSKGFRSKKHVFFNLNTILKESVDIVRAMNKNIRIDIIAQSETNIIYGNPHQIEQVLVNILKNSFEAIGNKTNGEIKVFLKNDDVNIILEIEDNAGGIDDLILNHVFKAFYTTKAHGTGLGLSIAKQIIKNHNGIIKVSNIINDENKRGTKFIVSLPIASQKKEG